MSASDPHEPAIPPELPQPVDPEMDPADQPEIPLVDPPAEPGDWRPRD
jgi:hypothetical protein